MKRHLPALVGTLVVLGFGGLVTWMIVEFMNAEPSAAKKTVQQITLLAPPPPPPPPPKMEEPPPEPEIEEEVEIPEPEAMEDLPDVGDEPPPGDALGLDADGSAGADGFGLVGRKGGRGLLSGDPHMLYASRLQRLIEDAFLELKGARKHAYTIVAKVWVGDDGNVYRAELSRSTGKEEIDDLLVDAIMGMPSLNEMPPPDMPNPIRLRISSRI